LVEANIPPYAGLTPDVVLAAVDSLGLYTDGHQLALNSYENRVYQIGIETEVQSRFVVVKFYRPQRWSDAQILEEHQFLESLDQAEIPCVKPITFNGNTLHTYQGFRFSVFPRQAGRSPDLENPQTLEWLGRFIGRIHMVGARESFKHRLSLNLKTAIEAREWILLSPYLSPELLPAWKSISEQAIDAISDALTRANANSISHIRLHGDCHPGNVMWTEQGPHFVDFDDAMQGPAIQDLWMLLSGERGVAEQQLGSIIKGYEQIADFNDHELALIEPLRTIRLLHYSAWIGKRWNDPAFPVAFPWFDSPRYWQDRILELREQVGAMQEPPLVARS
jgi:Ser/Thr protein kinase RdoA (MazF antagonist)